VSVGGRVAYTKDLGPCIEIVTWEIDSPRGEFTAIQVEKNILIKRYMQPGDIVWWQGRKAYWTPKDRSLPDGDGVWHQAEQVELAKIANSYAVSPDTGEVMRGP
jgi:hypothetical protein